MTATPECTACEAMATVIDKLMALCDKQQRMLMSFNRAGLTLAQQEVKMAELSIERRRVDTDALKAQASLDRAEALKITAEDGGPKPRFGNTGHTRHRAPVLAGGAIAEA